MKGLMIKEFCVFRAMFKSWLAMSVFFVFYSCFIGNYYLVFSLFTVIGLTSALYSFSYDNACRWDSFALNLPLSRSTIVYARYLHIFLFTALVAVINLCIVLVLNTMEPMEQADELFWSWAATLQVLLGLLCFIMPFIYKFGVEKARYLCMAIVLIPIGAFTLASRYTDLSKSLHFLTDETQIVRLIRFSPVFLALLAFISICLSKRWYCAKEF